MGLGVTMIDTATPVGPLRYGVAERPLSGQTSSGDQAVALGRPDGALLAVIDGLGHGHEAAAAAAVAADTLQAYAGESPVSLLDRCHQALRRTRGAAISLATVTSAGVLAWVAVGNVQGVVVTATGGTTRLVTRGGVVGLRLPPVRPAVLTLAGGDCLILFTDGVRDAAAGRVPRGAHPKRVAQHLLDRHATGTDDALVLVAYHPGAAR